MNTRLTKAELNKLPTIDGVKLWQAREWLDQGLLTTSEKPAHHGRSGDFAPVIKDGKVVLKMNNGTYKHDFWSLLMTQIMKEREDNLSASIRTGIMLVGWLSGIQNKELAEGVSNYLEALGLKPVSPGRYTITIDLSDAGPNGTG